MAVRKPEIPFECEAAIGPDVNAIAVAVSGGPDSMALLDILTQWTVDRGLHLHALSVDHALRPHSKREIDRVADWSRCQASHVQHHTLIWQHDSTAPKARIQEEARKARYVLMEAYCQKAGIDTLWLAHHRNDQAETLLMRLAAGSGLKGLGGMRLRMRRPSGLLCVRPLLSYEKAELVAYCTAHGVPYHHDPSNTNPQFSRARIRNSAAVLEQEGLTAKRLGVTADRLQRASDALDIYTDALWNSKACKHQVGYVEIESATFSACPEETAVRVMIRALEQYGRHGEYSPRMEKIEALVRELRQSAYPFRKRTLGGVIVEKDEKTGWTKIQSER